MIPQKTGPRDTLQYWKECMRALKVSEWTIGDLNLENPEPLLFLPVQQRLWAECKTDKERSILSVRIANTVHLVKYKDQLVSSESYAKACKRKPCPQFPRLIGDWILEGYQTKMKPKEISHNMNCKLVPVKIRTVIWRILNRAYKSGAHSGNNYPYKKCTICGTPVAGISHRYFKCPVSVSFWRRTQEEIWAPRRLLVKPGKDLFFVTSMQEAPPILRTVYYQLAIHQIHSARRAFVIDQEAIRVKTMVSQWKGEVTKTLERISKFGNLIPGKQSVRDNILATSRYIARDQLSSWIIPKWWSDIRSAQDL
ncbi:hypothetical protein DSO57_1009981 [Entomophthora muscae]|uniref:Uncharacterized protein n=1 Tax=Entomophthora muscae TaxID=34485 RepID=A0ACC2USX8_9FUNG|nr:hypothetical protein DSO57_1009981 [Entomophthora muscae]